jgi:hypothetical protein
MPRLEAKHIDTVEHEVIQSRQGGFSLNSSRREKGPE